MDSRRKNDRILMEKIAETYSDVYRTLLTSYEIRFFTEGDYFAREVTVLRPPDLLAENPLDVTNLHDLHLGVTFGATLLSLK